MLSIYLQLSFIFYVLNGSKKKTDDSLLEVSAYLSNLSKEMVINPQILLVKQSLKNLEFLRLKFLDSYLKEYYIFEPFKDFFGIIKKSYQYKENISKLKNIMVTRVVIVMIFLLLVKLFFKYLVTQDIVPPWNESKDFFCTFLGLFFIALYKMIIERIFPRDWFWNESLKDFTPLGKSWIASQFGGVISDVNLVNVVQNFKIKEIRLGLCFKKDLQRYFDFWVNEKYSDQHDKQKMIEELFPVIEMTVNFILVCLVLFVPISEFLLVSFKI